MHKLVHARMTEDERRRILALLRVDPLSRRSGHDQLKDGAPKATPADQAPAAVCATRNDSAAWEKVGAGYAAVLAIGMTSATVALLRCGLPQEMRTGRGCQAGLTFARRAGHGPGPARLPQGIRHFLR